jgi:hypothetical protein
MGMLLRKWLTLRNKHMCRICVCKEKCSAEVILECGTTFELVTFLHIKQTCLGFVDFRHNFLQLMESREELHMGKSRVNVIMTLLPFSHLEGGKNALLP